MSFSGLIGKAKGYLPPEKIALVEEAYHYASQAHQGQVRKSGEPYMEHPLQVALSLTELQLDASSLAAALLHDVPENCAIPISEIEAKFGLEIAKLVDGTTKLGKLSRTGEGVATSESQMENLRKMLVAMAEDLRVVFIKLADRLHNMRSLDALSPEKQHSIAQETLEIYAPLAHRLGIWELKWQLEDLSFHYLEPGKYRQIANMITARRAQRENFIAQVIKLLRGEFDKIDVRAEMSGRPKHIYSIHQKMEKYSALGKYFNDIHDLLALRILVNTVPDCYSAVGVIHSLWRPLPGEFDDYIANPKPNGYQSLHTAVMYLGTIPLEVQIRTIDMHHLAEYGMAAHWRYKEGETKDIHFEERIAWLRQLIEWHRELSGAEDFLESVKTDILIDQVFVFTPKGEIKDLPKGSTPLDFAYRIHTELGHRCIGAKVNGRLVPLNHQLNNSDVVEIMTTKKGDKGPSRDWLSHHLGYIKTSQAREKIRQWFKKQERVENIERGRDILEKELRRLGMKLIERGELAKLFKYDNVDDFLAAIGYGGITTRHIASKLADQHEPPEVTAEVVLYKPPTSAIKVLGVGDILTNFAQCCHPMPGDIIIGYVTRSRGVTVHRQDCYNVIHEDEKNRLIPVEWEQTDSVYPVSIEVQAWDRVGLIRDITTIVAEEKVNIATISFANHDDGTTSTFLTLNTRGLSQLSRLLARIEGARGVISITRLGDEATIKSSPSG
ncbi:MAG TPA: bifunctional (p)ppGpp synthetase/guanosine-3',5'-bis(diphosphate) 3'-pyrophosphohydrolase [Dehalococcoidia bacterium]|jgi:GTP pyrophosphokinase|nr:bifunctional (p)ppGpp synthetase/guanosine-3',5'-bis(diphosphate) 3'-pyrophosphohydrolase [Dehalococcoidia bacterium]